jgi:hypothetical protein
MADMPFQRNPHVLRQQNRVLFLLAPFNQRLHHSPDITYRNFLAYQALKNFGNLMNWQDTLYFFGQFWKL